MDTKNESRESASVLSATRALARDPLSSDDILADFYRPETRAEKRGKAEPPREERARPTHYKVVCISLYNEDIERLDALVKELKRRGHSKANKSQVIREALLQIDLDRVPRHH